MSTVVRGARNAFRNGIRTASVIALLGISTALALSLMLANQAVKAKIVDLKKSAATTLTLRPAGQFGGQGGGEPLTTADLDKVKALANVSSATASLQVGGPTRASFGARGDFQAPVSHVSLDSPIDPGTLGRRNAGADSGSAGTSTSGGAAAPVPDFKLPVNLTGTAGGVDQEGNALKVTSGTASYSAADVAEAVVGQGIATKNNLKVGSTFTGYSTTFKVVGIFDGGTEFANAAVFVPLATAQRLGGQAGEVSNIFVKADSIDSLDSVKTAITSALGADKVDISSPAQNTTDAITALGNIQQIALIGETATLIAASVITFLVMIMIVRERRREIGVLKAIGSSNVRVVGLFVTEALVLTLCGAVVGIALAAATSNPITGALVAANAPTASSGSGQGGFGGGGSGRAFGGGRGFFRSIGQSTQSAADLLKSVQTTIGADLLLKGLGAGVGIAILGSAIPAFLIAKVRPAEVMRGE